MPNKQELLFVTSSKKLTQIAPILSNKLRGKNPKQLWFLNFYFSLHFVKMFEYIKSYLKMSN